MRVSLHLLIFVSTDSNTETVQLPHIHRSCTLAPQHKPRYVLILEWSVPYNEENSVKVYWSYIIWIVCTAEVEAVDTLCLLNTSCYNQMFIDPTGSENTDIQLSIFVLCNSRNKQCVSVSLHQMGWKPFLSSSGQSSVRKISSSGWPVKNTRPLILRPSCCPKPNIFIQFLLNRTLLKRYGMACLLIINCMDVMLQNMIKAQTMHAALAIPFAYLLLKAVGGFNY